MLPPGRRPVYVAPMSPEPLHSLLHALPIPVILIGPSARVAGMNAAAVALLGSDATGRHFITALRQPALLGAVERCLFDGEAGEARYVATDGPRDTLWQVSVGAVALPEGRGALLGFEDRTALEESTQIRRDFVANVSHELRTPLTALLGFIETLRGAARDDPSARDRFLGIMEREAGRMAHLVDDLLSLSRVEQEGRVRPRDVVALDDILRQAVNVLGPVARQAGNELRLALPPGPVRIPGDAAQLQQVCTNLIDNALKYGGTGKPVDIRLTGPGDEPALRGPGVRLAVRDHGPGIEDHHIGRLTERFYRVDTHRSRELGGTGLGLAIVKHIVGRHRGRLQIDSVLGKGSQFTVILPALTEGQGADAAHPVAHRGADTT